MPDPLTITIRRYQVPLDPPTEVFHVQIERADGIWKETCTSLEQLEIFLRGVRAGSPSYVSWPEVPETAEPLPESLPN